MRFRWTTVVAAVLAVGVLVGCKPDAGTSPSTVTGASSAEPSSVTPTPTPTPSATPTPSPKPSLSSQQALNVEAERVYRAYFAEDVKIVALGGSAQLPSSMAALVTGGFAKDLAALYRDYQAAHLQVRNAQSAKVVWVRPAATTAGYEVTLEACEDAAGATARSDNDPTWQPGTRTRGTYSFKRVGDSLRIAQSSTHEVATCS